MANRFKSVADMMKDLGEAPAQGKEFANKVKASQISAILFVMRNKAKMTQGDLATKTGWSQSKVSKMEHLEDKEYILKDIADYCNALGYNLEIGFSPKSTTWLDKVKHHFFQMQRYLNMISESAKDDATIQKGVNGVMLDASNNLLNLVTACIGKVKASPQPAASLIVSKPQTQDELEKPTQLESHAVRA
jgi:transcriptional regulator with XRE-family HTH domain